MDVNMNINTPVNSNKSGPETYKQLFITPVDSLWISKRQEICQKSLFSIYLIYQVSDK